ncbi:uncharacterized protein LOC122943195 [Bufo gargarizans]|uniref:uncharacterized protein LOC122943195 n=1 Tax=Bufo gargarizans TaxID=30331 RepID=UPI001CF2B46A|nr:uncharacterized protein LOC122943195 [Bufo gargarizans]
MKIIILFALASVGVCTVSGSSDPPPPKECSTCEPYPPTFDRCDGFVNEYANDENCLPHALESVPQLLEIAKKLICKGRKNKLDKSSVYYAEFEKEMRDFMGCTGCFVGGTLGLEELLGRLAAALGGVLGTSVATILELIHSTGLTNPALDLICGVFTGELTSKCAEIVSNSDITANKGPLQNLACMARKETLDLPNTIQNLEVLGCIQKDLLGIKDALGTLTPGILKILDSVVKTVIGAVLNIPVVGNLLGQLECTALDLLNGLLGGLGG